ncbi:hypothetical protein ABZY90_19780 [Streptomyces sp. NPDC006422]|uniref:hypothetical protein n=1 Tax=unclassified Streptomyces TaxID=2593676 RepID=UPI0033A68ED3
MTGPEHYREAEKLLGYAAARDAEQRGDAEDMSFLAEAQVHADLAKAAATALNASVLAFAHDLGDTRVTEWDTAIAKTPKEDGLD